MTGARDHVRSMIVSSLIMLEDYMNISRTSIGDSRFSYYNYHSEF